MSMKELESKDLRDSVIPTVEVINKNEVDNMSNGEEKVKLEVDKYILKRWRKDVKRFHSKVKISYDNWDVKLEAQLFDKMCNSFYEVADIATNNKTKFCMVMEAIECLKAKLTLDASGEGSSQCGANLNEDAIGNGNLIVTFLLRKWLEVKDQEAVENAEVATINIESSASLDSHIFGTQESTALEVFMSINNFITGSYFFKLFTSSFLQMNYN
ncbi:hypothetical protein Q3G72_018051 [Acer saccharum]|nr:hypothetical protein Q3G72_018051 [Acer saccharum]